jgi:hypothetical protein
MHQASIEARQTILKGKAKLPAFSHDRFRLFFGLIVMRPESFGKPL